MPYRYRSILHQIFLNNFWKFFGVLIAAQTTRKTA
jgi:hypothetical protein